MRKAKKKINGSPGPQPINYRFTSDEMIFKVGDGEFCLNRGTASFLFGRNVEIEFEKANNQDDDFSEFEKLENLVLFRFYSRRQLLVKEIAKELNFPVDKYLRWSNLRAAMITRLMRINKYAIDKRVEELERENPLPEVKKEPEFWPDSLGSTGKKVGIMLLDGLGPREIAKSLKVPYGNFFKWYGHKDVMRNLMRLRNEEADKRIRKNEEIKAAAKNSPRRF